MSKSGMKHLQLKGNNWVYVRSVPVKLKSRLGGIKGITRTTGTSDIVEAKRFRDDMDAKLEEMMSQSLGTRYTAELKEFESLSDDDLAGAEYLLEQRLIYAHDVLGDGAHFTKLLDTANIDEPTWLALKTALGNKAELPSGYELGSLKELLAIFLKGRDDTPDATNKFIVATDRWLRFLGTSDCNFLKSSTKATVTKFVDHLAPTLKAGTIKGRLNCLGQLFQYAADRDEDYANHRNPFRDIQVTRIKKGESVDSYEFMEDDTLRAILDGMTVESNKLPAILCRHHGFRISELFTIMEDPQKGIIEADGILCFNITRGKTKAAVRIVPVHHSMLDVVKELRSGARPLCRSASSVLYSQRFGDSKRRLGLPRTQSLHSLRATFITLAMQVENPELMVAQVAGHTSGQTMTGQLYHKGFTTAQLQAVVNSVPAFDYTGLVD